MSAIAATQSENRAILKHMIEDARKPDGPWHFMGWHKDLFPDSDQNKLAGMGVDGLIEVAKSANSKARNTAKQLLLHAGQSGMALIALKEICNHGTFGMHLHAVGIEPRTAQNYMAIARKYETVSHLRGVTDALKFIKDATISANKPDEDWTIQGGDFPLDLGQGEKPAPPTPRPSPAAVTIEAEIVPEPQHEEPEPLVVEETSPAAEKKIEDGISKLKADGMILPTILVMLPHLTKSEIESLIETLNTRWK